MRSELIELERFATMQTVGQNCWETIERERAATKRRRRMLRKQESEAEQNEQNEFVPDRREY